MFLPPLNQTVTFVPMLEWFSVIFSCWEVLYVLSIVQTHANPKAGGGHYGTELFIGELMLAQLLTLFKQLIGVISISRPALHCTDKTAKIITFTSLFTPKDPPHLGPGGSGLWRGLAQPGWTRNKTGFTPCTVLRVKLEEWSRFKTQTNAVRCSNRTGWRPGSTTKVLKWPYGHWFSPNRTSKQIKHHICDQQWGSKHTQTEHKTLNYIYTLTVSSEY